MIFHSAPDEICWSISQSLCLFLCDILHLDTNKRCISKMNFISAHEAPRTFNKNRSSNGQSGPLPHHALPVQGQYIPAQWSHSTASLPSPPVASPQVQYIPMFSYQQPTSTPNLYSEPSSYQFDNPEQDGCNTRDVVAERLSEIISLIDEEAYTESSKELVIVLPQSPPPAYTFLPDGNFATERSLVPHRKPGPNTRRQQNRSINVLTKLSYYSNSRLPASLPPFRVYLPTYPLLCLAALCSANAYHYRQNAVKDEQHISADARIGTKAMIIKSVTCADEKTIVFAIRGTSVLSLRDWNVNLNTTPESPAGFLDDDGNYCHAGFLRVAKVMIKPIATRLRHLLEENPNRLSYSLLITGHSAGGAIASLLYAHMMSQQVKSELTVLADCFKRVHCVTFGAPPISLLPLQKPIGKGNRYQHCLFHSFINEGDPVVRAEKNYVMSLVDLLTTTPNSATSLIPNTNLLSKPNSKTSGLYETSMSMLKITNLGLFTGPKQSKQRTNSLPLPSRPHISRDRIWEVPPGTLSNAGRLVVLRGPESPPRASTPQTDLTKEFEEVRAYTVTDEEIRKVIFGDPLMHAMDVYRRRIEALAMKAVTGRDRYY